MYGNRTSFTQSGSRLPAISAPPAVNTSTNRFTSTNFTYDKNGNIIGDIDSVTSQARSFVFNADNKQVEVKNASNVTIGKYCYDGEGKRVKKVTATETTIFVYSAGKLVAEYSTQISTNPAISYMTDDYLGSPRITRTSSARLNPGAILCRLVRTFSPELEEELVILVRNTHPMPTTLDRNSPDTKKTVRHRLILPRRECMRIGMEGLPLVDPLIASGKSANPQTFNRYVYVGNSPLVITDPSGMIGDYYTRDGVWLGHDKDINDGKVFFASLVSQTDETSYLDKGSIVRTTRAEVMRAFFSANPVIRGTDNAAIRSLATNVTRGVDAAISGIPKGIGNAPVIGLNGVTHAIANGPGLGFYRPNPFEIPLPFANNNATEESYGSASATVTLLVPGIVAPVFSAPRILSIVPQTARATQFEVGTLSVVDWTGYPKGYPQPSGTFRLLQGREYTNARILASKTNRTLRSENPGIFEGAQIHEIKPVKFGGSPTDAANKIVIPRSVHEQQFTPWWNRLQRDLQR